MLKKCLVAGLTGCNCDAIAIAHNADKVIVVDYNVPVCEHELVQTMSITEFNNSGIKPQAAFSICTYVHDGLGRYGDPIDPFGDLKAMSKLLGQMDDNGLLYLAVPVGADCLVWNAHRIYGPLRLPTLLKGWTFLAGYGMSATCLSGSPGTYIMPVFVLSANPRAVNIPCQATPEQQRQIRSLASLGVFDRQYYIEHYPDVLEHKMDVISHYVLYGAQEGLKPTPWFDTREYLSGNQEGAVSNINPFFHYLTNCLA